MKIKLGQVIKKFKSKKGREVTIRVVKKSDWSDLLKIINSIIEEDNFIILNKKKTIAEEKKWLNEKISIIKKRESIFLCAEFDSKVIGSVGVRGKKYRQSHIGGIGISIMKQFREEGIGTELIKEAINFSKENMNLKVITLTLFENNKRALALYNKIGFKVYGKLPKARYCAGKYISEISMYKEL